MSDRLNRVEIIKLRTSDNRFHAIRREILGSFYEPDANRDMARLVLLRHAAWETDWSIHLHWDTTEAQAHASASPQGQRLISTLGEFGRVNHAVWMQDIILTGQSPGQTPES